MPMRGVMHHPTGGHDDRLATVDGWLRADRRLLAALIAIAVMVTVVVGGFGAAADQARRASDRGDYEIVEGLIVDGRGTSNIDAEVQVVFVTGPFDARRVWMPVGDFRGYEQWSRHGVAYPVGDPDSAFLIAECGCVPDATSPLWWVLPVGLVTALVAGLAGRRRVGSRRRPTGTPISIQASWAGPRSPWLILRHPPGSAPEVDGAPAPGTALGAVRLPYGYRFLIAEGDRIGVTGDLIAGRAVALETVAGPLAFVPRLELVDASAKRDGPSASLAGTGREQVAVGFEEARRLERGTVLAYGLSPITAGVLLIAALGATFEHVPILLVYLPVFLVSIGIRMWVRGGQVQDDEARSMFGPTPTPAWVSWPAPGALPAPAAPPAPATVLTEPPPGTEGLGFMLGNTVRFLGALSLLLSALVAPGLLALGAVTVLASLRTRPRLRLVRVRRVALSAFVAAVLGGCAAWTWSIAFTTLDRGPSPLAIRLLAGAGFLLLGTGAWRALLAGVTVGRDTWRVRSVLGTRTIPVSSIGSVDPHPSRRGPFGGAATIVLHDDERVVVPRLAVSGRGASFLARRAPDLLGLAPALEAAEPFDPVAVQAAATAARPGGTF